MPYVEQDRVLQCQPQPHEDVTVNVSVTGKRVHFKESEEEAEFDVDMPNCRQLSGKERHDTAAELNTEQTCNYQKLSQMFDDEVRAGNLTECQTPPVLHQATYERRWQKDFIQIT